MYRNDVSNYLMVERPHLLFACIQTPYEKYMGANIEDLIGVPVDLHSQALGCVGASHNFSISV